MMNLLGPRCGRLLPRRRGRCTTSRLRRTSGGYAPACARCLTAAERAILAAAPRSYVDVAKLRAGDRD